MDLSAKSLREQPKSSDYRRDHSSLHFHSGRKSIIHGIGKENHNAGTYIFINEKQLNQRQDCGNQEKYEKLKSLCIHN